MTAQIGVLCEYVLLSLQADMFQHLLTQYNYKDLRLKTYSWKHCYKTRYIKTFFLFFLCVCVCVCVCVWAVSYTHLTLPTS